MGQSRTLNALAAAGALAVTCTLAASCDPTEVRDAGLNDSSALDGSGGRDGPTADAASGDRLPTDTIGTDTAGADTSGADLQRPDSGAADNSDPRQCGVGAELCAYWGTDCGWVEGYDRCWEAASAFCGGCDDGLVCGGGNVCVPEICGATGWCWERPTPQANDILGIAGVGSDIWLVGDGGMVLRWDGAVFRRVDCDTTARLNDVWAAGTDDVWIVGWDGVVRQVTSAGCAPVDVGLDGRFEAISGSGPDDIWIGASDGRVAHRDSSGWSTSSIGTDNLNDLWVVEPGDTWAIAWGEVRRNAGGGWQVVETGIDNPYLNAGWGLSSNEVWVVGDDSEESSLILRWDGDSFTREETESTAGLNAIWGSGPDDLWAGGNGGCIVRRSEGQWTQPWPLRPGEHIEGAGGTGTSVMFGGNYGVIFHWDGTQLIERQQGAEGGVADFWGTSATDVWAAAHGTGTLHWDGSIWRLFPHLNEESVYGLWGTGDELWGVGDAVYSWTGNGWQVEHADSDLYSIWGSGPTDIWAGGRAEYWDPHLLHYDGVTWEPVDPEIEGFYSVWDIWGSSASDVWFLSQNIVHLDGEEWVTYEVDGTPAALWGAGPGVVWVAGDWGRVLRFNGSGFDEMMSDRRDDWRAIWGRGPDDVWVLSLEGLIAHWNGSTWQDEETGATSQLTALWGAASGDLWAAGGGGTILHRRP